MARRIFLVEMEGWNPSTSAVETLYWTDGEGFQTESGDTPANQWYEPALSMPDDVLYGRALFADGRTGGASQVEISDGMSILNADGSWDYLETWGWDGRYLRVYVLEEGQTRSQAVLVLTAVMEQLLPVYQASAGQVDSRMVIRLKDPLSRFDVPIQPVKYEGTNSGPTGLEGTADDIKGLPKPISYGVSREVQARPVNTSLLIYQVADGAIAEIDPVYDNGVALTLDADYATPTLLAAATPGSGEYATCLAYGLFMLGATPAGTITADISAVAAPLPSGDAVDLAGTGSFGSGDYYRRTTALSGAGTTDRGLISLWFRVDGGDGTARTLFNCDDAFAESEVRVGLNTANKIEATFQDQYATASGSVVSTSTFTSGWHHLLLAWILVPDGTGSYIALYIDDGNETNATVGGDDSSYPLKAPARAGVGARLTDGFPNEGWVGALAEVYVAWGQHLDITQSGARQKFRDVSGYPTDLGYTGAKPTGTSPSIYLRGGPDQFLVNLGTGGNLTKSGSPTVASSTPYAPPPSTPSTVLASEIIRDIATSRVGLTDDEIDGDAFDATATAAAEEVGIWIGDERNVRDVLDEIANSAGVAYWWTAGGALSVGRIDLPSGLPSLTWTFDDLQELERQASNDTGLGLPAYSVVVEHSRIYAVQDGNGLAGSVDAARRAYLEREYRQAAVSDNSVRAKHLNSPEFTFRTLITSSTDAAAFAADRLALYKELRSRWRARVALNAETVAVDLFDVVEIQVPRFGLDAGKLFIVLGIQSNLRSGYIDFDLWGGVNSPIRPDEMGRRITIHAPTVTGSGAQISPPYLGSRITIHSPFVRLRVVAPYLGGRITIHEPTVSARSTITAPYLGARITLHEPTVSARATIAPPYLGARATIHEPTVSASYDITVPYLGGRLAVHAPTVSARNTITPPYLGSRITIHTPALVYNQTISPPYLGSRITIHEPVVQSGASYIAVGYLGNRITIHEPTVAGRNAITVDYLGSRITIHEPSVSASAAIAPDYLGGRITLHEPTVSARNTITPPYLGSRITIHEPTVVPDQLVTVGYLGARTTIHEPAVAGRNTVTVGYLGLRVTIHEPTVVTGDLRITEAGDIRITEAGDNRSLE